MNIQGYSPQCGRPNSLLRGLHDPNCPKFWKYAYKFYNEENPPPYYMMYHEEVQRFKCLPDEQKAKYNQMEQQDRERYAGNSKIQN